MRLLVLGALCALLVGCNTGDTAGPVPDVHCFGQTRAVNQDSTVGDTTIRVRCPDSVVE